jgi:type II secretory ATPase GspE/PulE/Tfp pilus assembly ATPase PilB-like protein
MIGRDCSVVIEEVICVERLKCLFGGKDASVFKLGGVASQEKKLRQFLVGKKPRGELRGILLTGPTGSGKTAIVKWASWEN